MTRFGAALVVLVALLAGPGSAAVRAQESGAVVVDAVFVGGSGEGGIYIVDSSGTIDVRDGLPNHGDSPVLVGGESVVALAARFDASGYWMFTSAGRVHNYGAAVHHGDLAAFQLAAPIIAAAALPDGSGYWMVGADGGIFAFGSARFHGSVPEVLPGVVLAAPVIGIAPSTTGAGYMLVASDGGIFAFGDASFHGSIPGVLPGVSLAAPVIGVVPQLGGYVMVAADGGVFNFGASTFYGSLGAVEIGTIAAIAVPPGDIGYTMIDEQGVPYPFGLQVMLSWGYIVLTGEGAGVGAVSALFPYAQPWGGSSLVIYEFSIPEGYIPGTSVQATATGWPNEFGLTHPKRGDVSGFLVPEFFSSRWPIEQIGVNPGEGTTWTLRLAPGWYTPWLGTGDSAHASNESIWIIDDDAPYVSLVLTMDQPADLIAEYYPDSPDLAPITVSLWQGVPIEQRTAVVPAGGVLVVRSSASYTLEIVPAT